MSGRDGLRGCRRLLLLGCDPASRASIGSLKTSRSGTAGEAALAGDANAAVVSASTHASIGAHRRAAVTVFSHHPSARHDELFREGVGTAGGACARYRPDAVEISAAATSAVATVARRGLLARRAALRAFAGRRRSRSRFRGGARQRLVVIAKAAAGGALGKGRAARQNKRCADHQSGSKAHINGFPKWLAYNFASGPLTVLAQIAPTTGQDLPALLH